MDRERVAMVWVHRGLRDLYFAFDCGHDAAFENNKRFSEIMGLEKFMKAVFLYHMHEQYEQFSEKDARKKLNQLAMDLGHKYENMLARLEEYVPQDIERIRNSDFDGYCGSDLIEAVSGGYMETRYPVPTRVSDKFPIEGTDFSHDPLSSSGFTKYVYALCNTCFHHLVNSGIDFADMYSDFRHLYQHRESLDRFENLLWEPRCRAAL